MATNNNARSFSRFRNTDLILTNDGKETYGLVAGLDALKNMTGDQYTFYQVPAGFDGRPDLLANKFYSNSHYEWIIVIANAPKETLLWPKIGDVIKIPNRDFIRTFT